MNWYKQSLKKLATVDVVVEGYEKPRDLSTVSDLCFYVQEKLMDRNHFKLIPYQSIQPDGGSEFSPIGIINFYTDKIDANETNKITSAIVYWLKEINVEVDKIAKNTNQDRINHLQKTEEKSEWLQNTIEQLQQEGVDKIRVIRIHIKNNPNTNRQNEPPEIQITESTLNLIFHGILNFGYEENKFPVWQLLMKINLIQDAQIQEFVKDTMTKGNITEFGYDIDRIKRMLDRVKTMTEWASNNGYQNLIVE